MIEQRVLDLSPPLPAAPPRRRMSTSAEAIVDLERTGRLGEQQREVLRALKIWVYLPADWAGPGLEPLTSAHLAHLAQLDRYAVARRLPELARQGLAERAGEVICSISNRRATTWRVTPAGLQAVAELL